MSQRPRDAQYAAIGITEMGDTRLREIEHQARRHGTPTAPRDANRRQVTPYQAVAVAASVIPSDSSQRSASMAALQPSAAAVTAWR